MDDDWQVQHFVFTGIDYDPNKNFSNWQKHGITFGEAAQIFDRPVIARCQIVAYEERWIAVGITGGRFTTVVFCERGEDVRVISARGATPSESRRHGQSFIQRPA